MPIERFTTKPRRHNAPPGLAHTTYKFKGKPNSHYETWLEDSADGETFAEMEGSHGDGIATDENGYGSCFCVIKISGDRPFVRVRYQRKIETAPNG